MGRGGRDDGIGSRIWINDRSACHLAVMSEHQIVHFAAVDRPLNDDALEFMRGQSTRAEVTRRRFDNEYHYGDFRGDTLAMMRRGYDVHLHYANFGIRRLAFRLPHGPPAPPDVLSAYGDDSVFQWRPDTDGPGGILDFNPEGDADAYAEAFWDFDAIVEHLPTIRDGLIAGDLRPFYLMWHAFEAGWDDDAVEPPIEPPVPAGLDAIDDSLQTFAAFYELDPDRIAAAAEASPPLPAGTDRDAAIDAWLKRQRKSDLQSIVARVLGGEADAVRSELLATIRDTDPTTTWPTRPGQRTAGEIDARSETLSQQRQQTEAKAAAARRR